MLRLNENTLTLSGWLSGWCSGTAGIAALVSGDRVLAVWLLSLGALLIGLGGYRLIGVLLWHGLAEVLDAAKPKEDEPRERRSTVRRIIEPRGAPL